MDPRLQTSAQAMRIAIGLMATLAGIDKFFNLLVDWSSYVSPVAAQLLPFSPDVFMWIVGVIEFAVGISILTALPVVGSYVASAWLLLVAVNLTLSGYFDVAVRDVVLSIGAFALARLLQVRDEVAVGEARPVPVQHRSIA
jgi:uncharacterized membrane protein YphA (DoxX/SURF4 family)